MHPPVSPLATRTFAVRRPGRNHVPIEVTMPKLSPTMETGVIAQWLVKVGDQVKEGDTLAEIETDKATMPMKSYDDGTIVHIDQATATRSRSDSGSWSWRRRARTTNKVAETWACGRAKAAPPAKPPRPSAATAAATARPSARQRPSGARGPGRRGRAGSSPVRWPASSPPRRRSIWPGSRIGTGRPRHPRRRRGVPQGRPTRRAVAASRHVPAAARAAPGRARPAARRPAATPLADQRSPHTRMRKTIAQPDAAGHAVRPRDPRDRRHPRRPVSPSAKSSTRGSPPRRSSSPSATSSSKPPRSRCGNTRA